MFHPQYPFSPPPAFMPKSEEHMEFGSKEFDALDFFSEPDSVLDLGPHISPLNSPCSDNSSSIFSCYSPSGLSLSDDQQLQSWPEEYNTLQDSLDFTFNVSSPTASSVSSDLSHQSEQQQQQQEELDLLEDLLLDEDNSAFLNSEGSVNSDNNVEEKGVEIVHLLLACVENIQEGNTHASSLILDHLASSTPNAVVGSPLERVSTYIATALRERINKGALFDGASNRTTVTSLEQPHLGHAQRVFYQHFPFLKFAHFTANRAILESVKNQPRIHIVDLDIEQGLQWPNFIQVLAASSEEVPSLRITGVGSNLGELQTTGRGLSEFAKLVGLENFEYRYVVVSSPEHVSSLELCVREEGEALAVNCSMLLHRLLGNQPALESTLCMIRSWNPRVIAVAEVEANHNTSSFVDRFVESLHFYSAVFDCIESTLPRTDSERLCMESFLFGAQINNILACEGTDRIIRHAQSKNWRDCMRWPGFKELPLSDQALYQAHIFLSLYPPAYTLSRDAQALILGWHETPVVSVSTWSCY